MRTRRRSSEFFSALVAMVALLAVVNGLTLLVMPEALIGVLIGSVIGLPLGLLLLTFLGP